MAINSIDQFYSEAGEFITGFNDFVAANNLLAKARSDHICYKCDSSEKFERMREMFEDKSNSRFIYQSIISGRRIAYVALRRAIKTVLGDIRFLELSDQKPDGSQTDRFDHIEIYPVGIKYSELVEAMKQTGVDVNEVVRPHHTTHDSDIGGGFLIRLTEGPLLDKIKNEEMS